MESAHTLTQQPALLWPEKPEQWPSKTSARQSNMPNANGYTTNYTTPLIPRTSGPWQRPKRNNLPTPSLHYGIKTTNLSINPQKRLRCSATNSSQPNLK